MSNYKIEQIIINKLNSSSWNEGQNLLENKLVTKLGVQGTPGAIFRINDGNDITLGQYGIYELDVTGLGYLISFVVISLPEDNTSHLYLDYVCYEVEEAK